MGKRNEIGKIEKGDGMQKTTKIILAIVMVLGMVLLVSHVGAVPPPRSMHVSVPGGTCTSKHVWQVVFKLRNSETGALSTKQTGWLNPGGSQTVKTNTSKDLVVKILVNLQGYGAGNPRMTHDCGTPGEKVTKVTFDPGSCGMRITI